VGCLNIQFAVRDDQVYVIEANPRASRTLPYVSKATGVSWVHAACHLLAGRSLAELDVPDEPLLQGFFVKEVVLPFDKFEREPVILGPEMRSTGEVMGIGDSFGLAYAKAQIAARNPLPIAGTAFLSVRDQDKEPLVAVARSLAGQGFDLVGTRGTAEYLSRAGLDVQTVNKVSEGRPNGEDLIINGKIDLIINTPLGSQSVADEYRLRQAAIAYRVPVLTTISAARAATQAIAELQAGLLSVKSLQEYADVGRG